MQQTRSCNHTVLHVDEQNRPNGTWVVDDRGRVVCSVCGRFYGYIPEKAYENQGRKPRKKKSRRKTR